MAGALVCRCGCAAYTGNGPIRAPSRRRPSSRTCGLRESDGPDRLAGERRVGSVPARASSTGVSGVRMVNRIRTEDRPRLANGDQKRKEKRKQEKRGEKTQADGGCFAPSARAA